MFNFWRDWYVSSFVSFYESYHGKIDSTTFLKWQWPNGMQIEGVPNIPGC